MSATNTGTVPTVRPVQGGDAGERELTEYFTRGGPLTPAARDALRRLLKKSWDAGVAHVRRRVGTSSTTGADIPLPLQDFADHEPGEGPPPFDGAVYDKAIHRWVKGGTEEGGETPAPASPVAVDAPAKSDAKQATKPDTASLERAVSERKLHAGVSVRSDASGAKWVVKERAGKAAQAANEAAAAGLASIAGADVVPVHHVKLNGQDHIVLPLVDAIDLTRMPEPERRAALAAIPKQTIDRHALFDFAIGAADANLGNYMLADGGKRLVGIDKEQSLSMGQGRKATFAISPLLSEVVGKGKAAVDYEFDRNSVAAMADAADKMADKLHADGRVRDAAGVRRRAGVLKALAASGGPCTAGELARRGAELDKTDPPPGLVKALIGRLFGRKDT